MKSVLPDKKRNEWILPTRESNKISLIWISRFQLFDRVFFVGRAILEPQFVCNKGTIITYYIIFAYVAMNMFRIEPRRKMDWKEIQIADRAANKFWSFNLERWLPHTSFN